MGMGYGYGCLECMSHAHNTLTFFVEPVVFFTIYPWAKPIRNMDLMTITFLIYLTRSKGFSILFPFLHRQDHRCMPGFNVHLSFSMAARFAGITRQAIDNAVRSGALPCQHFVLTRAQVGRASQQNIPGYPPMILHDHGGGFHVHGMHETAQGIRLSDLARYRKWPETVVWEIMRVCHLPQSDFFYLH